MSKVIGLVRLIRPPNCVMTGLAVIIGELIVHKNLYLVPSLLGFLTAFTITGASMVTNDYWDRYIDVVNEPHRPIPSGLISSKLALRYSFFLMAIGLYLAFLTGLITLIIASVSLVVSLLYNYRGKKLGLLGNFMVSACITIPLIYGGFVYNESMFFTDRILLLIIFDVMVFLSNTGREVNKGIADVEGDKLKGIRTVAVSYSSKVAARVASLLYLSAVGLSILPWVLGLTSWPYLPIVAVSDVGFVISSFILIRDYSKRNALRIKKMVMMCMLVGLVSFFGGVFW